MEHHHLSCLDEFDVRKHPVCNTCLDPWSGNVWISSLFQLADPDCDERGSLFQTVGHGGHRPAHAYELKASAQGEGRGQVRQLSFEPWLLQTFALLLAAEDGCDFMISQNRRRLVWVDGEGARVPPETSPSAANPTSRNYQPTTYYLLCLGHLALISSLPCLAAWPLNTPDMLQATPAERTRSCSELYCRTPLTFYSR